MGFYPLPLTAQTEAAAAALEQQEKRRGEHEGTYSRFPLLLPFYQSRAVWYEPMYRGTDEGGF